MKDEQENLSVDKPISDLDVVPPLEEVCKHVEDFIGPLGIMSRHQFAESIHLDLLQIAPTEKHNFYSLVTAGMSTTTMPAPDDCWDAQYAELIMCLPADWQFTSDDQLSDWPHAWLRTLAWLAMQNEEWLCEGLIIPNEDGPNQFSPDTRLCGAVLLKPWALFEPAFDTLISEEGETVNFLCAVPIYLEEMELAAAYGIEALIERLDAINLTPILDLQRPNVAI